MYWQPTPVLTRSAQYFSEVTYSWASYVHSGLVQEVVLEITSTPELRRGLNLLWEFEKERICRRKGDLGALRTREVHKKAMAILWDCGETAARSSIRLNYDNPPPEYQAWESAEFEERRKGEVAGDHDRRFTDEILEEYAASFAEDEPDAVSSS